MTKTTKFTTEQQTVETLVQTESDVRTTKLNIQNKIRDLVRQQDELKRQQQVVRTRKHRLIKMLTDLNQLELSL